MKDAASRRNAPGSGLARRDPGVSEWGNPARVMPGDGRGATLPRAPGELNHLSTPRNGERLPK